MKHIVYLFLLIGISASAQEKTITDLLDKWHRDAAKADLQAYFEPFTSDAIYIGTDATEHWNVAQFKAFCQPYFDKKTTWDFKAVQRHIYFSADKKLAWFDEVLDTHMGLCRGSGVLQMQNGKWKISQYVLSMAIPNDDVDKVVSTKKAFDEKWLKENGRK